MLGYTWDIQVKIVKYTLLVMILIAVASMFFQEPRPFIYALIFGTLISILNFRNLALTVEKAVTMNPGHAQVYASSKYFIRFLTNAVVIFVCIKADYLNVLGAVLGLFTIKFVIIGTNLFNILFLKKIFKRKEEE